MKKRTAKLDKSVALFAKNKPGMDKAIGYLREHFKKVDLFTGKVGDAFPRKALLRKYDICVSYISPWVMPKKMLDNTREFAINFHPGPPEYRGIGCTNFAIYNNEKKYGVTVHIMLPKVDSGRIVDVRRFPISRKDTLVSLTDKCYRQIMRQFREVFDHRIKKGRLPECRERWSSKLYTRKELDELCRVSVDMPAKEIARRVKATDFPNMPKAYIELYGYKFEFKEA